MADTPIIPFSAPKERPPTPAEVARGMRAMQTYREMIEAWHRLPPLDKIEDHGIRMWAAASIFNYALGEYGLHYDEEWERAAALANNLLRQEGWELRSIDEDRQ